MVKYQLGTDLRKDVLLILECLAIVNESVNEPFNCHEGARIFHNILKKFDYKVEVVSGCYSSPHLNNGKQRQHSWVELIEPYRNSTIIETVPKQMFRELSSQEQVRSMIVPPDDKKHDRYKPVSERLMKKIFINSHTHIDKQKICRLSQLIDLCVSKIVKNSNTQCRSVYK